MKKFRIGLAVFMAILMAAINPITSFASAEGATYIKEVRVGYGKNGKKDLEEAGYTVWNVNANDGALGEGVWLGYKTTSNKSEAITDLAVMNMNGGYSFSEYQNLIDDLERNVKEKQEQILSAVKEFSKNYAAGSEYAKEAAKILKCYYYDEVEGGEKISLVDLFTAKELDENAIYKICLEGNTESLNTIVSALSLGIIEFTGDTALTRLAKLKYGTKNGKSNVESRAVSDAIEAFKLELAEADKVYKEAIAYEGGAEAYLEAKGKNGSNIDSVYYYYLYVITNEAKFGTTGLTIYQALNLPLDPPEDEVEEDDDEDEETVKITWIDSYMVDMLTKALSYGQIGVLGTVGLGSVLCNAYAANVKIDNPTGTYKSNLDYIKEQVATLDGLTPISVFAGVDRSLIEHPEDVAITTEALRKEAKKKETQYGAVKESSWVLDEYKTFQKAAAISLGTSIGVFLTSNLARSDSKYALTTTFCVKGGGYEHYFMTQMEADDWLSTFRYYVKNKNAKSSNLQFSDPEMYELLTEASKADVRDAINASVVTRGTATRGNVGYSYSKFASAFHITAVTISAIAMVVTLVFTILVIIGMEKIKKETIEYTKIPRAIVDAKTAADETTNYYVYYAVKQITAKDDETDYKKLYGDLNAFNEIDQWLCLYYTKDQRIGEPLTTNIMVRDSATLTQDESLKYLGVHDFGYKVAKDLNYYNSGGKKKAVYLFVERATTETSTTPAAASLFNLENAVIAISFLAVGAFAATAITFAVMKKKKKEKVNA